MAVDLQLALSLPIAINRSSLLDLNTYSDDGESDASSKLFRSPTNKKRSFQDSSESDSTETPARNLLWNKQPKDDDDRPNADKTCNLALIRNGDEREGIVGWPPIQTFRRKQRGHDDRNRVVVNGLYVKAQIEGVLITRKIDLSRHRSFEALASAVLFMFGRGHESVAGYDLTYQDREGDWLLATDLPWRAFLESVQRLRLMRKEE